MKKICIIIFVYSVTGLLVSCGPSKFIGYKNNPMKAGYWPKKTAPTDKEKPVINMVLFTLTSIWFYGSHVSN